MDEEGFNFDDANEELRKIEIKRIMEEKDLEYW